MQRTPGKPSVHLRDAIGQRDRAAELLNDADAQANTPPYSERQTRLATAQANVALVRLLLADQLTRAYGGESK